MFILYIIFSTKLSWMEISVNTQINVCFTVHPTKFRLNIESICRFFEIIKLYSVLRTNNANKHKANKEMDKTKVY